MVEIISNYVNTEKAAKIIGKSPGTLANDRVARRGLPYVKLGAKILYSVDDIQTYLEDHKIYPEE